LGRKYDFEVTIVPHESTISSREKEAGLLEKDIGAVGVACVLNLISGGLMLKGLGIPAQCVILDYCGCKNHWHDQGIPTDINMEQLKQMVKEYPSFMSTVLQNPFIGWINPGAESLEAVVWVFPFAVKLLNYTGAK
jgi:Uncharacterized conserved protein